MKTIISLTANDPKSNFEEDISFFGQEFRIIQLGTGGDFSLLKKLIRHHEGLCDVISITHPSSIFKSGKGFYVPALPLSLFRYNKTTPMVDGNLLSDAYLPWAIHSLCSENKTLFKNQKIGFYSGLLLREMVRVLEDFKAICYLGDPYFYLKWPHPLKGLGKLDQFYKFFGPLIAKGPLKMCPESSDVRPFRDCSTMVLSASILPVVNFEHLRGKIVIIDTLDQETEKKLRKNGVQEIITLFPRINEKVSLNISIMEAIFSLVKEDTGPLNPEDVLHCIHKYKLGPQKTLLNTVKPYKTNKFAFIVHPLGTRDIFRYPVLKPLMKVRPLTSFIENMVNNVPALYYGKMTGIESTLTGQKVEGEVWGILGTPRVLMQSDPEVIYKKLIKACAVTAQNGAEVIGLGAYTKIVGDAGLSVAKGSPIPVTTGNSLSAAATLWAANLAVVELGLVKKSGKIYQGRAMVIGATGSIGAVSAKLLAQNWTDLILVAPRIHKLLELEEEIKKINPKCRVRSTIHANLEVGNVDLIISSTSNQGRKILDIEKVKSGCVICDVSRPFDISEEEAMSRPDVLVVASGEVELPGQVKTSCDLGLEGDAVYACLAETAILALEGRFESFTLSRNISYKKVQEIDRLAKKHGVKLASIMGHAGPITQQELKLCREHVAKKKRSIELLQSQ